MTKVEQVQKIIEELKPNIQLDGGDIEFVSYNEDEKIVYIELKGACVGCPMSSITLKQGIEYMVKQELPEVVEVVNIGEDCDDEDDDDFAEHETIEEFLD
jgi:Fe-S cluster biogenesis protein NfuA